MADPIVIPVDWDQQALSGTFIASIVDQAQDIADLSGKGGIPFIERQGVIDRLWAIARGIAPPNSGDESAINSWTNNRSLVLTQDVSGTHVSTRDA